MTLRTVVSIHKGYPTSDGAGVKLTRVFDARQARVRSVLDARRVPF